MFAHAVRKILVVDSDGSETIRLSWELPRDKYALTFTQDLSSAMELARKTDYDVALVEVDLPGRSSFSLLRQLRHDRPETKVVMMTDYGDDDLWLDVMNEGASDLISRPIARVELERSLS